MDAGTTTPDPNTLVALGDHRLGLTGVPSGGGHPAGVRPGELLPDGRRRSRPTPRLRGGQQTAAEIRQSRLRAASYPAIKGN